MPRGQKKSADPANYVEMGKKKKRGSKPKPHSTPRTNKPKKSSGDTNDSDSFVVAKTNKGRAYPVPVSKGLFHRL